MENKFLSFLSTIHIDGAMPLIYPEMAMVQWNLAGKNYGDRCFQAVIQEVDEHPFAKIQVLRRSVRGGYDWLPLENIPLLCNEDTRARIIRTLSRWMALGDKVVGNIVNPPQLSYSFKEWVVYKEQTEEIRSLIQAHFGVKDLSETIDPGRIQSFLGLSELRKWIKPESIASLKETIGRLSTEKLKKFTLNWLLNSLTPGEETNP